MKRKIFCSVVTIVVALISTTAYAEHNRQSYDFSTSAPGVFPERYATASGGDIYLGPFAAEAVTFLIMDVLPAENGVTGLIDTTTRRVQLQFDLVYPSFAFPVAGDRFKIFANDLLVFDVPSSEVWAVSRRRVNTEFVLTYAPPWDEELEEPLPFDLVVRIAKEGSTRTWGLDNVVIDWSQPIPEPSTWMLAAIALACGWLMRRRTA